VPTGTRRPGSSRLVLAASLVRRDRGGRDWFFGFTVDEFDPCRLREVFLSSRFLGLGDDWAEDDWGFTTGVESREMFRRC